MSLTDNKDLQMKTAQMKTVQRRTPTWQFWVLIAITVASAFLPLVVKNSHTIDVLSQGLVFGIAATGIGMLVRQTGLINFGAGAIYGAGAYFFGIACTTLGLDMTPAVLLAIGGTLLLSFIVGVITVRAGHLSFAILTLALSQVLLLFVGMQLVRPVTGGTDGLIVSQGGTFFGLDARQLFNPSSFWIIAWGGAVLAVVIAIVVERSKLGRITRAIQENEERMRAMGYGTFWPRLSVFMISGLLGGLAGMINGLHYGFVSPELLSLSTGADILVSAFIGGVFSPIGPLIGALIFALATDAFAALNQLELLTGFGIIVAIVFMKNGVVGLATGLWNLVFRRSGSKQKGDGDA